MVNEVEGPIPVPIEAVQLCIANAERLLEDGQDVTEPTSAALIELALEEILKGWILFFNLTDQERWPATLNTSRIESQTAQGQSALTAQLAKALSEKFSRIPKGPEVRKIFGGPGAHPAKLAALDFILTLVESQLSSAEVARRAVKMLSRTVTGQAFNLEYVLDELDEESFKEFRQAFKLIHPNQAPRLAKLKEVGLYVNLEGNVFTAPDTHNYPDLDVFGTYVQGIVDLLKGAVSAQTGIGIVADLEST